MQNNSMQKKSNYSIYANKGQLCIKIALHNFEGPECNTAGPFIIDIDPLFYKPKLTWWYIHYAKPPFDPSPFCSISWSADRGHRCTLLVCRRQRSAPPSPNGRSMHWFSVRIAPFGQQDLGRISLGLGSVQNVIDWFWNWQ